MHMKYLIYTHRKTYKKHTNQISPNHTQIGENHIWCRHMFVFLQVDAAAISLTPQNRVGTNAPNLAICEQHVSMVAMCQSLSWVYAPYIGKWGSRDQFSVIWGLIIGNSVQITWKYIYGICSVFKTFQLNLILRWAFFSLDIDLFIPCFPVLEYINELSLRDQQNAHTDNIYNTDNIKEEQINNVLYERIPSILK